MAALAVRAVVRVELLTVAPVVPLVAESVLLLAVGVFVFIPKSFNSLNSQSSDSRLLCWRPLYSNLYVPVNAYNLVISRLPR